MSILATTGTAEVVAANEAWVRRVVRRRMADPALVDDAVQETLLRVCRSSPPDDPAQLRAWLTTIAKRACVDVWRAHRRTASPFEAGPDRLPADDAVVPGSDEHLRAVTARHRINRALGQLSPRHRRLLEKQALFGLTYEEIADEEDVSVACVTSALGRARAGFRRGFAAPAVVLVERVRSRLGHAGELVAASVTIGVAAAVLVAGDPPPRSTDVVVRTAVSTPEPPGEVRAVVAASGQASAPSGVSPARPPARARGGATAVPQTPSVPGSRPVGDVTVHAPRIEKTPERWTVRYGFEVQTPDGTATWRSNVTLHCTEGSMTAAMVCPIAPQP